MGYPVAARREHSATRQTRCDTNIMDRQNRRARAPVRHLLGVVMQAKDIDEGSTRLEPVALLTDIPEHRLGRGQVGTIVEQLDPDTALVEFSDDQGRAFAVVPCLRETLLVLHYAPEAA